ncbi:MAG: hypothetical protein K6B74_06645 [Ruminococcus sp.]|nr:hypothetical protein [Ruminococcus sp.]
MYCIKCGVELADSEDRCPLCGTTVYHPDIEKPNAEPLFPDNPPEPHYTVTRWGGLFILTSLFLLGLTMPLICDLSMNGGVTWSGVVMGAIGLAYVITVLPFWFKSPNPVVFVPIDFAACGLFLFYLNLCTGGNWFLKFALPTVGMVCVITTAVITLCRYLRRGYLFIFGGATILSGISVLVMEWLLNQTFGLHNKLVWSIYPFAAAILIGLLLLIIAVSPKLRASLQKKFFV